MKQPKPRGVKPKIIKGATMTAKEIYADVPRSSFFCRKCGKPASDHSYCDKHWKSDGLEELENEDKRIHQERLRYEKRCKQMWR